MKFRFLSVAAAALMFAACNEPLNDAAEVETDSIKEEMPIENVVDGVSDKDVQFKKFAEILSRAVSQNQSVREFLKEKALEKIDNDYNVFYPIVRNEMIDGKSFESILGEYADNKEELKKVFEVLPLLNIHIPELVKQVADFDTEDDEIPVLYNYEMYCNGQVVDTLGADEVPGFDILVVTESTSIRKKTNFSKIVENTLYHGEYEYVSKIFNPIYAKKPISKSGGTANLMQKYTSNYIDNSCIDNIVINAAKNASSNLKATRSFIYYDMTNPNQTPSALRTDIKECIYRFKINGNALRGCEDAASSNGLNPIFYDDYEHTAGTVSRADALDNLLTGRNFELRFVLERFENQSYSSEDYFIISVRPTDLFNICIKEEKKRHKTWFKHSKYKYTVDYSGVKSRWYYPLEHDHDTRFNNLIWDFQVNPYNRRITVYVENPSEGGTRETTDKITYTYVKSNQFSANLSVSIKKIITLGISGGFDTKNTNTEEISVKYYVPQASKKIGTMSIDFFNNYPLCDVYPGQSSTNSLSNGDFTMDMMPISDAFYQKKYKGN